MDIPTSGTPLVQRPFKSNLIGVQGPLAIAAESPETLDRFFSEITPLLVQLSELSSGTSTKQVVKAARKTITSKTRSLDNLAVFFNDDVLTKLSKSIAPNAQKSAQLINAIRRLSAQLQSPLGILTIYRQHLFVSDVFAGPLEHAFTVAPKETVEVRMETQQRRTFEQSQQQSITQEDQQTVEQRDSTDVTDRIAQIISRSTNSTISASVSGTIGVVSGGISGSQSWGTSDTNSREIVSRRLTETVNRVSESMTRAFTVSSKTTQDFLETNSYRRTITNEGSTTINYGLRRLFQTLTIKQQFLGPRLVWQVPIKTPSLRMEKGALLNTRILEGNPNQLIGPPEIFEVLPYNLSLNIGGSSDVRAWIEGNGIMATAVPVNARGLAGIVAVYFSNGDPSIEFLFKDKNDSWTVRAEIKAITETFSSTQSIVEVAAQEALDALADPGDQRIYISILIEFKTIASTGTTLWAPSRDDFQETLTKNLRLKIASARFAESTNDNNPQTRSEKLLESWRQYFSESSKATRRASDDLRKEERSVVLSRLIYDVLEIDSDTNPEDVYLFNEVFDLEQFFTSPLSIENLGTAAPSKYYFGAKDAARFGASLSWELQPDADDARNMFMNAKGIAAFLPIKPGREDAAIEFLQKRKQLGGAAPGVLEKVLTEFATRRSEETGALALFGPDDVFGRAVDPAIKAALELLYPIYREFDTVAPIEGFIYESINLKS